MAADNASILANDNYHLIQATIESIAGNSATETYIVRIGQPPDISIASITAGPYAYASGSRVYYNNNGSNTGWFTVTARITDTGGGLQFVRFPTTTSAGVFSTSVTAGGLYPWGYDFNSSDTFSATVEVTAGNVLNQWQGAPFTVTRDLVAPGVSVNVPTRVTTGTIPVSWTSSDGLSGPTHVYTVSVMTPANSARGRADTGPLQLWLGNTSATSANFTPTFGHRYTFVVTATDNVRNTSQGTATTDAIQVTKYYYLGASRVAMRRSAPTGTAVTYLHTNHLGTVSIATSASGQEMARTLNMPYGSVRWSSGTMPTDYGFTGMKEPMGTGLVYLHARYYSSWVGRFVSADTIVPNFSNPQSLNRFSYVYNNPLRYTDPTGYCGGDENDPANPDYDCWKKLREIEAAFDNVSVNPDWWKYDELVLLMDTLQAVYNIFGSQDAFKLAFGNIRFNRGYYAAFSPSTAGQYWNLSGDITLFDAAFTSDAQARFTIIHEMGHAFDLAETYKNGFWSWFAPPKNVVFMKEGIWSTGCIMLAAKCNNGISDQGVTREYAKSSSSEDFADTFAVYIYNQLGWSPPVSQPSQNRLEVIKNFVALVVHKATGSPGTP